MICTLKEKKVPTRQTFHAVDGFVGRVNGETNRGKYGGRKSVAQPQKKVRGNRDGKSVVTYWDRRKKKTER